MFKKMKNYFEKNMESISFALAAVNGTDYIPYMD